MALFPITALSLGYGIKEARETLTDPQKRCKLEIDNNMDVKNSATLLEEKEYLKKLFDNTKPIKNPEGLNNANNISLLFLNSKNKVVAQAQQYYSADSKQGNDTALVTNRVFTLYFPETKETLVNSRKIVMLKNGHGSVKHTARNKSGQNTIICAY